MPKSFIYRRQIDSLADQSVRPARKPLLLAPFRRSSFLFDYFSSFWSRRLPRAPNPPGVFFFFFLSPSTRDSARRNKQLLSTFRPAKWEKAAAGVQLATSLTGFARISNDGNVRAYRNAERSATLTLYGDDADENRTARARDSVKLWLPALPETKLTN